MRVEIVEIKVDDLNVAEIEAEYEELQEGDVLPEDEDQLAYYSHHGHRVYVKFVDEHGADTNLDKTTDNLAALLPIQPEVNAAIVAAGAKSAEIGWGFSDFAYCGTCSCSPGFLVAGTGPEKDATVTIRVIGAPVAA